MARRKMEDGSSSPSSINSQPRRKHRQSWKPSKHAKASGSSSACAREHRSSGSQSGATSAPGPRSTPSRRRRKIFRRKRSRSLSTGSTTVTADRRKVSALGQTRDQALQQRQVSQQPLACARPTSGLETKLSAVKETAFLRASRVSPFRETEIREDAVRETDEDGHAIKPSVLVHRSRTNQ